MTEQSSGDVSTERGEVTSSLFAYPLSNNLHVAKRCIELRYLPEVFLSATITQILLTGGREAMVTAVSIRCCRKACFFLLFFYLGLQFNCVSSVSAVAPVSDGTDVWISLWHFSLMKIHRPLGGFNLFKFVLFISQMQEQQQECKEVSEEQQRWASTTARTGF